MRVVLQVSEQPLSYGALTVNGRRQVRYNVRKLSELPYHLIESGMVAELRMHVLFNYDWLHSKLAATSLPDVLADFHMATTAFGDAAKVYCCSFISKISPRAICLLSTQHRHICIVFEMTCSVSSGTLNLLILTYFTTF